MEAQSEELRWVNTPLDGDELAALQRIQAFFGFKHRTETVRYLIRQEDRRITGQRELPIHPVLVDPATTYTT